MLDPRDASLLDRAVVVRFPGPDTATGDDIVELQLHGSVAVVEAVEAALSRIEGLVAAGPGDFTRRAFDNGRVDLSQVEGLADLLAAQTQAQRIAALTMAEGGLRRRVEAWQARTLELAARVEAALDYADEGDVRPESIDADLAELTRDIADVLASPPAERLRDGVRVVIAGPPNAGKSSLLNALAGREAAIVTPIAGTTRDVIEVPVMLGGMPVIFSDTAGLRDAPIEAVEAIGIARATAAIARADIIVWLGAPEDAPPASLLVQSKCDLPNSQAIPSALRVSAITKDGIGELIAAIGSRQRGLVPDPGGLMLSMHQKQSLSSARQSLIAAGGQDDEVLRAEELRSALRAFDSITGRAGIEAVFDALFSRFCIGK